MTKNILNLFKRVGETPLQCIRRFQKINSEYKDLPMTYAGRLDPMAEGVLLVLAGDACKQEEKNKYLSLSKVYESEILFGVKTDTYDALGLILEAGVFPFDIEEVTQIILSMKGKRIQKFPPFSSKPVNGKPLFVHARDGSLNNIDIPTREIEIFNIEILSEKKVSADELYEKIKGNIALVGGDFRQKEILDGFSKWYEEHSQEVFPIILVRVFCSSGTYIRSLANDIGDLAGSGALALSIKRIAVGDFMLEKSMH